jgi:hypothetical protein
MVGPAGRRFAHLDLVAVGADGRGERVGVLSRRRVQVVQDFARLREVGAGLA